MGSEAKEIKKLAKWLKDDLEPLLNDHLANQIATLVINYGYRVEVKDGK